MGKPGDLADVVAIMDDAQAFQLMVVETVIVRVIERRAKNCVPRSESAAVRSFISSKVMRRRPLCTRTALMVSSCSFFPWRPWSYLAHREADFGLVGGGFDAQLAFDSVRFDDTADH